MNRILILCAALSLGTAVAGETPNPDAAATEGVAAKTPEAAAEAAAAAEAEHQATLRQTLRQMRTIYEQEDAQVEAAARAYTQSVQTYSVDNPGIGAMREQFARQFERLEDRCFGMDAKVNGGNLIVICGDNAGSAENANIGGGNHNTTVIVPPPPPAAPAPQPEEEAS
jgi:hypothetical protein